MKLPIIFTLLLCTTCSFAQFNFQLIVQSVNNSIDGQYLHVQNGVLERNYTVLSTTPAPGYFQFVNSSLSYINSPDFMTGYVQLLDSGLLTLEFDASRTRRSMIKLDDELLIVYNQPPGNWTWYAYDNVMEDIYVPMVVLYDKPPNPGNY